MDVTLDFNDLVEEVAAHHQNDVDVLFALVEAGTTEYKYMWKLIDKLLGLLEEVDVKDEDIVEKYKNFLNK
jgi:hypothetical protein